MENKLQASSTISFSTQAEADQSLSALSQESSGDAIALVTSPMKEHLDLTSYLSTGRILCLCAGGDPEPDSAALDFTWILDLRRQCIQYDVPFYFTSTGANFLFRGHTYHIEKKFQASQARKANVHYFPIKRALNPPVCESVEIPHINFDVEETDSDLMYQSNVSDGQHYHYETLTIPGINYEIEVEPYISFTDTPLKDYCDQLFQRLDRSKFRSGFHLHNVEKDYYTSHGEATIYQHACDFIRDRLAPAEPANDGKQTPMKGHPVFIAQHATACCCRGCLKKWHHIPEHRPLTESEQERVVGILMTWIKRDLNR